MSVNAVTWDEFQESAELLSGVRKTLGAVVAIGPADAPVPGAITTDGVKVNPLPEEYEFLGLLPPEGVDHAREMNFDETEALGHTNPVRRDPGTGSRTVTTNLFEVDRRIINELIDQVDLSDVTPDATTGEVEWEAQDLTEIKFHRLVVIAFDGSFTNPVFDRRFFPKVQLTSLPNETFAKGDARQAQLGFTIYKDDTLGYPVKVAKAGLGFKEIAAALGW